MLEQGGGCCCFQWLKALQYQRLIHLSQHRRSFVWGHSFQASSGSSDIHGRKDHRRIVDRHGHQ
jgi:hypothetical protein